MFVAAGAVVLVGCTADNDTEPAVAATVTETVTEAETAEADPAPTATVTETATVTASPSPDAETEDEGDPGGPPSTVTAGQWEFTDIQVADDRGEFRARARATNNGGAVDGMKWEMTLLLDGSVVGLIEAIETGLIESGETVTIEFTGRDETYSEWDQLEIRVDTQIEA